MGAVVAGLIVKFVPFYKRDIVHTGVKEYPEIVVSIGQEGGITAHTIKIESPKRGLTEKMVIELNKYLPEDKNKSIKITSVWGDQEALQLATKTKAYLESGGWKVDGVRQAMYNAPVFGMRIVQKDDGSIEIIIGAKP